MRARRFLAALAAAALLAGLAASPLTGGPAPAAGTDCVTYDCAYMSVMVTGDGYAHIVDDQGVIDCYYNAGSYYGACQNQQYYWIDGLSPTLTVMATATGTQHSYTCNFDGCAAIDAGIPEYITLHNGDSHAFVFEAHLAKAFTWTADISGSGAGRVTSNPAGINCAYASSAMSGTCTSTWYFTDSSKSFYITLQPNSSSWGCANAGSMFCSQVGKSLTYSHIISTTTSMKVPITFTRGTKIAVAIKGKGEVAGTAGGLICPPACTAYYKPGTPVTVTATPAAGYRFGGWTGACELVTSTTCDLSVGGSDLTTTANFVSTAPPPTPRPTAAPTAHPTSNPAPSLLANPSETPVGSAVVPPSAEPREGPPSASPGDVAAGAAGGSTATAGVLPAGPSIGDGTGSTKAAAPDLVPLGAVVALLLLLAIGTGFVAGRRRRPNANTGPEA